MNNILKPLGYALLGGGIAVMTTAGAIDLPWFNKNKSAAALTPVATAAAQATQAAPLPPLPQLPAGSAPNYRAIVQQYGPAVVGVTVEACTRPATKTPQRLTRPSEMTRCTAFFAACRAFRTGVAGPCPTSPSKARARASSSRPTA